MGAASFAQTNFTGGEWSPQMQGRFDRDDYRTGLNVCLNLIPIEEGACPRRSGTRVGGVTRNGSYAVIREYNVDQAQPYDIELTAGHLRLWQADAELVTEAGLNVTAISSANPAVFTVPGHGYSSGDQVLFTVERAADYAGISQVLGRQLTVTKLSNDTFTVADALTGAGIDGTAITFSDLTALLVFRIFELATPYAEADLQDIRIVQDGVNALLLHHDYAPRTFAIQTNSAGLFTGATIGLATFHDGPYLDIPSDGSTLTPSATSGSITFTCSDTTNVNGGLGFQSTDVGRMFRVFSEPLAWASGTAYSSGAVVKEAGVYWRAVQNSTGVKPSTDNGTNWNIDTTAAAWTWGTIESITNSTHFVGTLAPAVKQPDNIAGGNLLYTNAISAWQLGAFSDTTGYPSTGAYYQGRVWLGGAQKNRFDACVSNDFAVNGYINFSPSGLDGTVADNNGIAGTLNAREIENFLWMLPDEQGVLAGTQSGEWIIASSGAGEPITPTSILVRETTHYGSTNAQAIKVGRATIFVHRDTRKVYEYMANYFTQKFVADNLALRSKHLTVSGVAEIAYMRELTPVVWCRLNNGNLIGCTYKHDDPIKPMEFNGWHRHQLGTNRNVISIQGGPANGGETDTLSLVTQDPITGYCYVEFLQTIWDDDDNLLTAWYLDGASKVAAAERLVVNGDPIIRVYGLWYLIGEVVTVWGAGLDLGDYTVASDGTIDLPLNVGTSLFTDAYLADVTALGCTSISTDVSGPDMTPLVYVMAAKENYDPTRVTNIAALTTYNSTFMNADQRYQGVQWDAVRRNLMYMYTENLPSSSRTNNSGHTLWDGATAIVPDGAVDPSTMWNSYVATKNIDTEVVTFHSNYVGSSFVPNGIGGSDGTWYRYTRDFRAAAFVNNGNGPGMTDPYTGNFWIDSESCELYCFRLEDNYSQVISPLFPVGDDLNSVIPVGFTNTGATKPWTFAREIDPVSGNAAYLYLVPRLLTATEISADYLLIYAQFTYPTWLTTSQLWTAYNREVFDHAGNMYLFSCSPSGGKAFKLYKFAPPTSAPYGGPTVGGGFTDITPWGATTGPNGDGATYTLARGGPPIETADIIPMYLPVTDDLVLISKFFPAENTAGSLDPALMFWSCTYVHGPAGSPSFDHHSAFVTGYMTKDWASTDIAGADYAVSDAFEVNNYLGQSDYLYDIDYTKRWFFFVCRRMTQGVSEIKPRIVLIEYSFVYGSAPSVVQVIDEQGWDDAYPDYAPRTNDVYAPYNPVETPAVAVSMATLHDNNDVVGDVIPRWDNGIYDPATNSFWWSGGATNSDETLVPFCKFDPYFADRMQTEGGVPGGSAPAATPPFMKLSFAKSYCAPFIIGSTFISQGQILRPASPQESMTQTGPSQGKFRRSTSAGVLLNNAQGMSMGVDFLTMRPLQFKTPGGARDLPITQTFSGIHWGLVDANSNYDNMWCWQITRPYPCTVVAVEVQHKANENV